MCAYMCSSCFIFVCKQFVCFYVYFVRVWYGFISSSYVFIGCLCVAMFLCVAYRLSPVFMCFGREVLEACCDTPRGRCCCRQGCEVER